MKSVCLISVILILLSSCIKKDNSYTESISGGSAENNVFVKEEQKKLIDMENDNNLNKKDNLIELIKKVTYPEAPDQWIFELLKRQEAFLELEKHSDELLDYALDLYQDKALTLHDQYVLAYALQSAEFEKFKYYLRDLSVLYVEEGKIDKEIAGFSFFPGNNHRVSENIQDPVIREAFETVLKSNRGWPHAEGKAGIIDMLIATQSEGSTNNYQSEPREPWQRYDLNGGNLIIHNGVTFIRVYEFQNKQLTSVTIPDSVTFIRSNAFENNQLTSVIIPDGVTHIETNAFANNPLTNIVIPDSIGFLEGDVFGGSLRNGTQIIIGANVNFSGTSRDVAWPEFRSFYLANGNRAGTYTLRNGRWSAKFR